VVCLPTAPQFSCSLAWTTDGCITCCGII